MKTIWGLENKMGLCEHTIMCIVSRIMSPQTLSPLTPSFVFIEAIKKFLQEFNSHEELPQYGSRFKYLAMMVGLWHALSFSLSLSLSLSLSFFLSFFLDNILSSHFR